MAGAVAAAAGARADSATSPFDQANQLYEQGHYGAAAAAFEKMTQTGPVSAAVYFNLGNAWFKAGQLGRAICAYRRAAELTVELGEPISIEGGKGDHVRLTAVVRDERDLGLGDWVVNPKKFPHGDADMKAIVDRIHRDGFLAQLWWAPMMTAPHSRLWRAHPEWALKNRDGSRQKISYWDSYYLCPANQVVIAMNRDLVRKILVDWGFDGLKLDGQYMNAAPPCYNRAHHHARPEESVEGLQTFFQAIYQTAMAINPDAVIELSSAVVPLSPAA